MILRELKLRLEELIATSDGALKWQVYEQTVPVEAVQINEPFEVADVYNTGEAGDYLCQSTDGSMYPVKREVFEATHKPLQVTGEWEDKLPGGQADEMAPTDFPREALEKGFKVELEHTDEPLLALEIAMDHLAEEMDYYDKLETIHKD